jgi:hypothetical protein
MNALNTLWDLYLPRPYRDGGSALNGFDFRGIESAVKIKGRLNDPSADNVSWSAEVRIPWKAMAGHNERTAPHPGGYFRFNLSRVEWRTHVSGGRYVKTTDPATAKPYPEYNWVYAPTGVVNIHYPELWAFLYFASPEEKQDDGALTNTFTIPKIEKVKWELRKVYYAEREFFENNNAFTDDVNALGIVKPDYEIHIEKTTSMFEACAYAGGKRAAIRQDGFCWVE